MGSIFIINIYKKGFLENKVETLAIKAYYVNIYGEIFGERRLPKRLK